ncbi:acyl-CoA dehydrogenase family protein [Arthrobacter crystallopoietes]|uniref:Acyl-CoA dehydrogenase n=1 Tax=Crystallibacter crystallopoietes TaxID=37928 RepID=A0A1H1AJP5_9MICC|nr:acyl-CoA dehydrogenase family protein [Arthrobacter crystallopoietes]AUI51503.1 acyl-CoA dehydrogenase [Arthrobacter crystallopoietes]SDQ39860.1 Acyl-CoA dehydrogenase [Arthrobacter crystallopoietes]
MSQTITETTGQLHVSSEHSELLERIEEITPLLMSQAAHNEELGHLTETAAQALHDAGIFRLGIPKDLGGYEASPRQVIEVIEKLSYADASTGWAVMALQMITGTTAAYQGAEATDALFADGGYHLMAGQGTRLGTATKVDGGYLLSGSWSFASGLPLASHIHTAALVEETGEALIFTFPKEQAQIVDNWDVMGLKATGSIDYSTKDLFVPQAYTYNVATKESVHGGALYRMGLANMSGINHAGWALGVGRRMLDEMKMLAQKKSGAPGASVDTDQFAAEYAKAEATLRSARAFVMDVWSDNEATLDAGEILSAEQETLTRLALNNATWSAHEVCMSVYKWAATAALREGDLQRFFRDMHAGTQHMTSGPVVLQACGRMLSGLAKNAEWVFFSLVENGAQK